jgi:hypothetical protein
MRTYPVTTIILILALLAGCQPKWVRLDGETVRDARLEEAKRACRVERKLTALERAEEDRDDDLARANSNEAEMLVREDFDQVRRQVYREIYICMDKQGYRLE